MKSRSSVFFTWKVGSEFPLELVCLLGAVQEIIHLSELVFTELLDISLTTIVIAAHPGLSSDVKKVFLCFTETSEVPQHHKSFDWDGQQEQTSETRLQLDPSGSAAASAPIEEPLIDIEIETDLCDNLDNFLEVDMLSVEDPDDTQGPDNHHWSCYPVGKN